MFGSAVLVGLGTGWGGVCLTQLIQWIQSGLYGAGPVALPQLGAGWLVLAPVLGTLVAGPIIAYFAPEAKAHGVPEVTRAMALNGGRSRPSRRRAAEGRP